MTEVLATAITLYILVFFARAILSWFPLAPGGFMSSLAGVLVQLTEPVLRPVRRVVPPIGVFDTSFLVVTIGLYVLRGIVSNL